MESLDLIQQLSDEHATKATGFLNFMEKFCTYFGLNLSHIIFAAIKQLAITLQNQGVTLQEAVMASLAEQFISSQRTDNAFDSFILLLLSIAKWLQQKLYYPDKDGHQKESMIVHHHTLSVPQRIIFENSILKFWTSLPLH